MRKTITLAIPLLAMTLLSSGMASAADTQPLDNSAAVATAQESSNPHTLANRNAAAKALKAELDKQNADATVRNAELDQQNAANSDQSN